MQRHSGAKEHGTFRFNVAGPRSAGVKARKTGRGQILNVLSACKKKKVITTDTEPLEDSKQRNEMMGLGFRS